MAQSRKYPLTGGFIRQLVVFSAFLLNYSPPLWSPFFLVALSLPSRSLSATAPSASSPSASPAREKQGEEEDLGEGGSSLRLRLFGSPSILSARLLLRRSLVF